MKEFYEEGGSFISYYIYPNGQKTLYNVYDSSTDIQIEHVYESGGKLIGYSKMLNCNKEEVDPNDIFEWNGKITSSEKYHQQRSNFTRTFRIELKLNE